MTQAKKKALQMQIPGSNPKPIKKKKITTGKDRIAWILKFWYVGLENHSHVENW
jgi:hypothetical protein